MANFVRDFRLDGIDVDYEVKLHYTRIIWYITGKFRTSTHSTLEMDRLRWLSPPLLTNTFLTCSRSNGSLASPDNFDNNCLQALFLLMPVSFDSPSMQLYLAKFASAVAPWYSLYLIDVVYHLLKLKLGFRQADSLQVDISPSTEVLETWSTGTMFK